MTGVSWAFPGGLALIGAFLVLFVNIAWFVWAVSGGDSMSGAQAA